MNAFYALDDIKKRTKKFYDKRDGIVDEAGNRIADEEVEHYDKGNKDLLDDNYIFRHFYQNKIGLIKQHKKEEREEKEAYMDAHQTNQRLPAFHRTNEGMPNARDES